MLPATRKRFETAGAARSIGCPEDEIEYMAPREIAREWLDRQPSLDVERAAA